MIRVLETNLKWPRENGTGEERHVREKRGGGRRERERDFPGKLCVTARACGGAARACQHTERREEELRSRANKQQHQKTAGNVV